MLRSVLFGGLAAVLLAGCDHTSGLWGNDEFEHYSARMEGVTIDAGDAPRRNIALQTNNPYPAASYDHNIPVNGSRMVRAVECFEGARPTTGTQTQTNSVGVAGGGVAVGTSQTTSKPTNDC